MAAITPTRDEVVLSPNGKLVRYSGTGTANQGDTLTTTVVGKGVAERLVYTACHYSDTATQAGVTTTIDSGLGAGFDAVLNTGAANAEDTVYSPDEEIWLMPGDAIIVSAPAGGSGVIATIVVVLERR